MNPFHVVSPYSSEIVSVLCLYIFLRGIGWNGMDWIDLAQDRDQWRALVKAVMNVRVPYNAGKFLSRYTIGSFSRRAQLCE
jgi:hypothetical protein